MPPIDQKRTQAFVNHFLVETVNALNRVAEVCEEKMDSICSQVDRMETMLSILEDKVRSCKFPLTRCIFVPSLLARRQPFSCMKCFFPEKGRICSLFCDLS